LIISCEHLNH